MAILDNSSLTILLNNNKFNMSNFKKLINEKTMLISIIRKLVSTPTIKLIIYIKNNKKKSILAFSFIIMFIYYLNKKVIVPIISLYKLNKQMSEIFNSAVVKNNCNDNNNYTISLKFKEPFAKLISRLLEKIEIYLESIYFLKANYNKIINTKLKKNDNIILNNLSTNKIAYQIEYKDKQEIEILWNLFKKKVFISLISSICTSRILTLLSQTQLIVLENFKSKNNNKYKEDFYDILLNELWIIALKYIDYIGKYIENRICQDCDNISLKEKFDVLEVTQIILKLRYKIENFAKMTNNNSIYYKLLNFYLFNINDKINFYEKLDLSKDKTNFDQINNNVFGIIKFFKVFLDIISSNLFTSILIKCLDEDYNSLFKIIYLNYIDDNTEKLSTPKLVCCLYRINKKIMTFDNSFINSNSSYNLLYLNNEKVKKNNYYNSDNNLEQDLELYYNVICSN